MIPDNPACFANHMGLWLCRPDWLGQALSHIQAGTWKAQDMDDNGGGLMVTGDGTAVIPLFGPMMKAPSKFGGASTLGVRRELRTAAADDGIRNVLLHIDSPGGHVAGTDELAEEVRRVNKIKPVHAHIDDLGASAALWVASQARRVTANRTAEVGSVGVLGVLEDSSGAAERDGVVVHVISTGEQKAAGIAGVPVTDAQLEHHRGLVAGIFSHFTAALKRGRRMTDRQIADVSDGRIMLADEAKRVGLIDDIQSLDDALSSMPVGRRRRRAEATTRRIRAEVDR